VCAFERTRLPSENAFRNDLFCTRPQNVGHYPTKIGKDKVFSCQKLGRGAAVTPRKYSCVHSPISHNSRHSEVMKRFEISDERVVPDADSPKLIQNSERLFDYISPSIHKKKLRFFQKSKICVLSCLF
jgi:hypothetical protein